MSEAATRRGAPRILPPLSAENRAFWTGGAEGELRIQRCGVCARWVHPPASACPICSAALAARAVSGRGTVFTFTVNHQPFRPEVPPPYVIAIVELAEQADLRIPTNLVNCEPDRVTCGMRVRVLFEKNGEIFVPLFEPDDGPSDGHARCTEIRREVSAMSVGAICVRSVQIAAPEETLRAVAARMARADVGTVVVLGEDRKPLGIVTDRDLTLRCLAEGRDPDATAVRSVMSAPVTRVHQSTPIESALARMAGAHARRLVVVDDEERLVGILALDDVLELLAEEATSIGKLLHQKKGPR